MLAKQMQALLARYLSTSMAWTMVATNKRSAPITVSRLALDVADAAQQLAEFLGANAPAEHLSREMWGREAHKYRRLFQAWSRV